MSISQINASNPDIVIFWQVIMKPEKIRKIKARNIIWIPMEDGYSRRKIDWLQYKSLEIKIICFSKTTLKRVRDFNFEAIYTQYFPPIRVKNKKSFLHLNLYFWQRDKGITWETVRKIIDRQEVSKFLFRNILDPFIPLLPSHLPSEEDIKKYNIIFSNKWLKKEEMEEMISEYNVFLAPRPTEGIGLSFLDAMALGLVVIAPNNPTYNEYIKDGINGYLYNLKNPSPIDFSNIKEIGDNNLKILNSGRQKWIESKERIFNFIEKKPIKSVIPFKESALIFCGGLFYDGVRFLKRKTKEFLKSNDNFR